MAMRAKLLSGVAFAVFLSVGSAGAQTATEPQAASPAVQTPAAKTVRRVGDNDWPDAKKSATENKAAPEKATSTIKTDPLSLDAKAKTDSKTSDTTIAPEAAKSEPAKTETTGQAATPSNAPAESSVAKSGTAESKPETTKVEPDGAASIRLGTDASGRVAVNTEQERQIGAAMRKQHVEAVQVDFDVKVGTAVPGSVRLGAISRDVVEVLPQFRGYSYFATREEIVIVEPSTKKIVALLPVRVTATAARPGATKSRAASNPRPDTERTTRVTRSPQNPEQTRGPVNIEREITVGAGGEETVIERITPRSRSRTYRTLEPSGNSAVIIRRAPRPVFEDDDDD
jgi:hypothetical protein